MTTGLPAIARGRFRSGVLNLAPPAIHVALADQMIFAVDDGQTGVVAYGVNMPEMGVKGVAPIGVLQTKGPVCRACPTCNARAPCLGGGACGSEGHREGHHGAQSTVFRGWSVDPATPPPPPLWRGSDCSAA